MNSFREYLNRKDKPIIIFDGGTGTSFQNLNLTAEDFGGKELEGCNENLVLSLPNVVEQVHNSFLEAGCHVIETNTFGASSIVLDEYNISKKELCTFSTTFGDDKTKFSLQPSNSLPPKSSAVRFKF